MERTMSIYKTVIGQLSYVDPVPDYYFDLGDEVFLQVKFRDSEQADATPLQTKIALSVTAVPDNDGIHHVFPGLEYYQHVTT
jgi:hypothetical protein